MFKKEKKEKKEINETCIKLTISLSKYVYETLNLKNVKNRSKYIERLLVLGIENELGDDVSLKSKFAQALTKMRELKDEKDKLNSQLGLLKKQFDEYKENKEKQQEKPKVTFLPREKPTPTATRKASFSIKEELKKPEVIAQLKKMDEEEKKKEEKKNDRRSN